MRKIRRFFKQIRRVVEFLPIVWKGRDFDYRYALDLFQFQLKRLEKEINTNRNFAGHKNTTNRINTAIELIDKVYDGDYELEGINKFEELYGKTKFEFKEIDEVDSNGEKFYEIELKNPIGLIGVTNDELCTIRDQMIREAREKHIRAEDILWRFISHNITGWWD